MKQSQRNPSAEISDAIPPVYSNFIAEQFLQQFAAKHAVE
jgi:hypothetical protein